ncbi:MAG TPA: type I methionyl aminopeptidase, partial [Aminobacteriaceae bacterium]|nr:type I methionyl aminopeptidase [Aminobacteriaceae bacterium]
HGIPSRDRFLEEGDIISIDVGTCFSGYYGDAACTYPVGRVSPVREKLLSVTKKSLEEALLVAQAGRTLGDIGHAVERCVLESGYGIVRDYSGHGIGKYLHEPPQIPNYGQPGRGITLKSGMTLAIEPMVMTGSEDVVTGSDQWVVKTADGSDAAHFEKSVLVKDGDPEILTPWAWA